MKIHYNELGWNYYIMIFFKIYVEYENMWYIVIICKNNNFKYRFSMVFEYGSGYRYLKNMVIIYIWKIVFQKNKYWILNSILVLKKIYSFYIIIWISITKNSWSERNERSCGGMFLYKICNTITKFKYGRTTSRNPGEIIKYQSNI